MPPLTRWFVKSALVCFIVALVVGVTLAARGLFNVPPLISALQPVYFHLLMVGWVTQLIFGIAFWLFPKFSRDQPRGSERLGWASFALLNGGLLLRVIGEPLAATTNGPQAGWLIALSAVLQWLAGMAFVINSWARVKEK